MLYNSQSHPLPDDDEPDDDEPDDDEPYDDEPDDDEPDDDEPDEFPCAKAKVLKLFVFNP